MQTVFEVKTQDWVLLGARRWANDTWYSHGDISSKSSSHCNTEALEVLAQDILTTAAVEARIALTHR